MATYSRIWSPRSEICALTPGPGGLSMIQVRWYQAVEYGILSPLYQAYGLVASSFSRWLVVLLGAPFGDTHAVIVTMNPI